MFSTDSSLTFGSISAETSRGYSFVIGLLVQPLAVLRLTARTQLSLPQIKLSTTANFHLSGFVAVNLYHISYFDFSVTSNIRCTMNRS